MDIDIYPLTPAQNGILFQSLYAAEPGMYLVQLVAEGHGACDRDALERAFQRLAVRHPILRTSFAWEGLEEPLQAIHPSVAIPFRSVSLEDSDDVEAKLSAFLRKDREIGFDLGTAPL